MVLALLNTTEALEEAPQWVCAYQYTSPLFITFGDQGLIAYAHYCVAALFCVC